MITNKELEKINNLKSEKEWLNKILKGFKDPYLIRNRIGLVKTSCKFVFCITLPRLQHA